MGAHRHPTTPEQREKIYTLALKGITDQNIAKRFGLTGSAVSAIVRRVRKEKGITTREPRRSAAYSRIPGNGLSPISFGQKVRA